MLRFIGEQFGTASFGPAFGEMFGWIVGIVFCLLLLSAANTAIVAMIGLLYMMARDGEMPRQFTRLNRHGVPQIPLLIAVGLRVVILTTRNFKRSPVFTRSASSARSRSISARACFNARCRSTLVPPRPYRPHLRHSLSASKLTLAHTKPDALFFVICVLGWSRPCAHTRTNVRA